MPTSEVTTRPSPQSLFTRRSRTLLDPLVFWSLNYDSPYPNNLFSSRKSIEDMLTVKITELDVSEWESCAICLGEYEVGGKAKEMPCKHIFHSGCIEKWLEAHRSCPVCRYKLPKKKGNLDGKVREEEENRGRGRRRLG